MVTVSRMYVHCGHRLVIVEVNVKVSDRVAGEVVSRRLLGQQHVATPQHVATVRLQDVVFVCRRLKYELLASDLQQTVQLPLAFRHRHRRSFFVKHSTLVKLTLVVVR